MFSVRVAIFFLALLSVGGEARAQGRDVRSCLRIFDTDRRVECLEGRGEASKPEETPQATGPIFAPSFDCARATTPVEVFICSDSSLSKADADLGKAFSLAMRAKSDPTPLIIEQRNWLLLRNSRCLAAGPAQIRTCLLEITTKRVTELSAATARETTPQPSAKAVVEAAPLNDIDPPREVAGSVPLSKMASAAGEPRGTDETSASKVMLESVQALLSGSSNESVRFFKYNVDKKDLQGLSSDMHVLRIVYNERVFFDTDKSTPRPEATPVVKSIADTLKRQRGKVALFVAGHTDARGAEQYNLDLSIRRAEAIARAIRRQGPGTALLWRVGFGRSVPIRPNTTDANMALNRRVEFLLATQPDVITAWIKTTKGLCESEDCGSASVVSTFVATPIDQSTKAITVEIPSPVPVEVEVQFQPIEVGPPLQ